jgi:hypothetical protein
MFAPLDTMLAALPATLAGGALLDLFSDQLRSVLVGATQATVERRERSPGRVALGPPLNNPLRRRDDFMVGGMSTSGVAAQGIGAVSGDMPATHSRKVPASSSPPGMRSQAFADLLQLPAAHDSPAKLTDLEGMPPTRLPFSGPDFERAHGREPHGRVEGGIFARKLAEYWRVLAAPARHEQSATAEFPALRAAPTLPDKNSVADPSPPIPTWRELAGEALAERMQAFVSGSPRTSSQFAPPVAEQTILPHAFAGSAASHISSTSELSEILADLLREQAIQHGIDIT